MEVLLVQVRGPAEGGRGSGKQVLLLLLLVVWYRERRLRSLTLLTRSAHPQYARLHSS